MGDIATFVVTVTVNIVCLRLLLGMMRARERWSGEGGEKQYLSVRSDGRRVFLPYVNVILAMTNEVYGRQRQRSVRMGSESVRWQTFEGIDNASGRHDWCRREEDVV